MSVSKLIRITIGLLVAGVLVAPGLVTAQVKPRSGGELVFVVPSEPPSYDAHQEETFGVIHPMAPLYSTLLRVDPVDKTGTRPVGDLAESWTVSKDGMAYTFKIRQGVKFHDGSALTSKDIKASYDKIVFPPTGIKSLRKEAYDVIEVVEAPDPSKEAGALAAPDPRLTVKLDLQGRSPRQGHPLVREERDGDGRLRLRRARQRVPPGGQEDPRVLGQGQAVPRRLSRHLHQCLVGPGGGHPRRAGAHPVPRLQPARARSARPSPRAQDHGPGEPA